MLSQIEFKFGTPTDELTTKIRKLNAQQLDDLSRRILNAVSLGELRI